eukprot:scaffold499_cov335-Pavlova_lutheri.AAC.4
MTRSAYRMAVAFTQSCMLRNWKNFGQQTLRKFLRLGNLDRNTSCVIGIQYRPGTMFIGIPLPKNWGWAYKDDALISDVAVYEKWNEILPKTGISAANKAIVLKHKQVQFQQKTPIVQNTLCGKVPWVAAIGRASTVQLTSLQALPKANLQRAGQFIAAPKAGGGRYTIRFTDGYEGAVTHHELESPLYRASTVEDPRVGGGGTPPHPPGGVSPWSARGAEDSRRRVGMGMEVATPEKGPALPDWSSVPRYCP